MQGLQAAGLGKLSRGRVGNPKGSARIMCLKLAVS